MPLNITLKVEIFGVWEIDFMVPFPPSYKNTYIQVIVDYISKCMEVVGLPTKDAKVVVKFVKKHVFTRIGIPRAIISNGGTPFINN